jgi:transcriptional regulator with XRE-family HTH domain
VSDDQPTDGAQEGPAGLGSKTFAERLDLLFKATHPAGRGEVGYPEVVEAMANAGGPSVTPTYLYMLRTGRRSNPRADLIQALARYFRVPAGYFLDDDVAEEFGEQLKLLAAIRDSGTAGLALRAQGLSPASREALAAIMERLRAADGLTETTD